MYQHRHPLATKEVDLERLVTLFRFLADKTRLKILMSLGKGERNVTSLCEELNVPEPSVSHHLGLLRASKLVSTRRDGKQIYYKLNPHVDPAQEQGLEIDLEEFGVRFSPRSH